MNTTSIISKLEQETKRNFIKDFYLFAKDIRISHTLFALPFVGTGLVLSIDRLPTTTQIMFILACMFFARSFAMGVNRIHDAAIDKANPRTKDRLVASGRLNKISAIVITALNALMFSSICFVYNFQIGLLSLLTLMILGSYSFLKKYVWWTHFYLGLCLGIAPLAAYFALKLTLPPIGLYALSAAIMFWTAGFDLLYATQDELFDRANNLKSAATKFGIKSSVQLSRLCFLAMIALLIVVGKGFPTGLIYWIGVLVLALVLAIEHILILDLYHSSKSKYLTRVFFDMNALVSVGFFIIVCLDRWLPL